MSISVTEINGVIKNLIVNNLNKVYSICGEISNIKRSNSCTYFSLKDESSVISVVFWKLLDILYKNGDKVIIDGKITCYVKNGSYQLVGNSIEKSGVGDLFAKQEDKEKFGNMGYFSKKRNFPDRINRIGILTSSDGAALQDILYVLRTNNFMGDILVKNCSVQGNLCPNSVSDGIKYFCDMVDDPVDIIVIARGGGSIEDLIGYSSEIVVKTIYESTIFTISAIGHEIDFMLSDFASDYRAPTPSIAGEIIIKHQKEYYTSIQKKMNELNKLKYIINTKILNSISKINDIKNHHNSLNPINTINNEIEKINNIAKKLKDKILHNIHTSSTELDKLKTKNNMFNTKKITKNGYAIISTDDGELIDSVQKIKNIVSTGEGFTITLSDGSVNLYDLIETIT